MTSPVRFRPIRTGARRAAGVAVAAAVLAAPLLVAAPAAAAPFPISAVAFGQGTLDIGQNIMGYFNGDTSMTEVPDSFMCMSEYKNGTVVNTSAVGTAYASASFGNLTSPYMGFVEDDVYSVAFHPRLDAEPALQCVAPDLNAVDTVSASITIGALPVPVASCPTCSISASPITIAQGVAVDMLVPFQLNGPWDWSASAWAASGSQMGGEDTINPFEGLVFESIESAGVAPKMRIHGTPKYNGTFDAGLVVGNGVDVQGSELVITITPAAGSSAVTIDAATGAPIAGAPVNVVMSGLKPGAAFSVTVRSTPVIIGSGTVAIDGVLAQTFTIPAGLEAGRHSVTLSSTLANGTTVNAVLYFTVSATGTLVAVSLTAPALVATGADSVPAAVVAGSLLLIGSAFAGAAVYRRRKVAA